MPVKVTSRTRTAQTGATAKSTAKKSTPAKKTASKAPATKTTARATPSRARKSAAPEVKDTPAPTRRNVRSTAKKEVVEDNYASLQERRASADPRKRVGGLSYKQISELTGYGLGTEQFIAAVEILAGGQTKLEVSHRVAALLPPTTRNGTPKAISNLVGGVIKNLESRGFTINGSWKMVAPKA